MRHVHTILSVVLIGLVSGCRSIAILPHTENSAKTEDESVQILVRARRAKEPPFVALERGFSLLDIQGVLADGVAYLLEKSGDQYRGGYRAEAALPNAVTLVPATNALGQPVITRHLSQTIIFERSAGGDRAVVVVIDLVPVPVEGAELSYFRIEPRSVICNASKVKMTDVLPGQLKGDRMTVTVKVTVVFPDGRHEGGLAEYVHAFDIEDLKIGERRAFARKSEHVSEYYEVSSEGPMSVAVEVTEQNKLGKGMTKTAEALRGL